MKMETNPNSELIQSIVSTPNLAEVPKEVFDNGYEFQQAMMMYNCAIREVKTKLEVLNDDLTVRNSRNPIEVIKSRVKKPKSIVEKLKRKGHPVTIQAMMNKLDDIAGVRVICSYRSYHMIIEIPVFFSDRKQMMRVEVQIRTIAMDFWASLDHQLQYKKEIKDAKEIGEDLRQCAEVIGDIDARMLSIRQRLEMQEAK